MHAHWREGGGSCYRCFIVDNDKMDNSVSFHCLHHSLSLRSVCMLEIKGWKGCLNVNSFARSPWIELTQSFAWPRLKGRWDWHRCRERASTRPAPRVNVHALVGAVFGLTSSTRPLGRGALKQASAGTDVVNNRHRGRAYYHGGMHVGQHIPRAGRLVAKLRNSWSSDVNIGE